MGPDRTRRAAAYTVVAGEHEPIMLPCQSLNVSMSLQRLFRSRGEDDTQQHPWGKVACGLRTDAEAVRDAVASLAQGYKAGAAIPPIKVLARLEPSRRWASTGFVVDGAIRVQAALEAGIAEIPAQLVAPAHPDTPIDGLFLALNWTHGSRLTVSERNSVLRRIAARYIADNTGPRSASAFASWLCERLPLPSEVVEQAVRNEFQVRTKDEWDEALRLGRGGAPTAEQLAKLRELGITPPPNGRLSPGQIAKLIGVSRAAVEKQFARAGIRPQAAPRPAAAAERDGHVPDATPALILESEIPSVDARATAQDILSALKPVRETFERALNQINDWVLKEAPEYRYEQAKLVWNVLDPFWHGLLRVNRAFRIYSQDSHLAERDLDLLRQAAQEAEAAAAASRKGPKAARRAG